MESSGSLSSFETKPEIAEFLNVSPPAEAHAILRRPGISVSPDYDHDRMMAVANLIGEKSGIRERREQHLAAARKQFSRSAVRLIGEELPWDAVGRGAVQKFRCDRQVTYFIGNVDHGIKIGISLQPIERLSILQTGSPVELRILACVEGGREVERDYHSRFRDHRKHGEWFTPHAEILAEIARINASVAA